MRSKFLVFLPWAIILLGLYVAGMFSNLLLHSIAEIFCITIALSIFVIAWNSRGYSESYFMLFLGIAFLFIGFIDLVHTIVFSGLDIFLGRGQNLAFQLWIAARYMTGLSLLASLYFLRRKFNPPFIVFAFLIITTVLLLAIFSGRFPLCFQQNSGLTPFINNSEIVNTFLLIVFTISLWRERNTLNGYVHQLLIVFALLAIASELTFTFFTNSTHYTNLFGLFFKVASFFCLYKALITVGISHPYDLLFRNLKVSENRYRELFNNMSDGVAVYQEVENGKDFIFQDINQAGEKIGNVRKKDIQGKSIQQIFPGVKEMGLFPILQSVWQSGEHAYFPDAFYQDDRLAVWLDNHVYKLPSGEFVAVYQDISEKKRAEDALRENQRMLTTLMGNLHGMAYRCKNDPDWTMEFVSDGCLTLTGYQPADLVHNRKTSFGKLIHPDDTERVWDMVQSIPNEENSFELEYRIITATGKEKWVWEKGTKIFSPDGSMNSLEGFITDITERKITEAELRKSEALWRSLVKGSPFFILTVDNNFNIEFANRTIPGLNYNDMIGKPIYQFNDGEYREGFKEKLEGVLETGEAAIYEYTYQSQEETNHLEARITPRIVSDNIVGLTITIQNITTQKRAEIEREHLLQIEREQRLLAETLAEVTLALTSRISLEDVLDEILRQAQRIVPYTSANITLLKGDILTSARFRGYEKFGGEELLSGLILKTDELPIVARAIRSGKPVLIPDTLLEPEWRTLKETSWIRSYLSLPICLQDRVLGLLRLDSEVPNKFSSGEMQRLQPLVNAAAIALENARLFGIAQQEITERKRLEEEKEHLFQNEREQRLLAETLTKITLALASLTSPEEVLDEILRQVQKIVPYSSANIALLEKGKLRIASCRGYEPICPSEKILGIEIPIIEMPIDARAVALQEPLVVHDTHEENEWVSFQETNWIRSYLTLPITLHDNVLGLVRLDGRTPNEFSISDAKRLQPLVNAAAIALENARLFDIAQRELAERKQAQNALREYSQRLEEMVKERTQALEKTQEKLMRREKLAVLGQLAGGLAHELRNPLGAIKNAAYYLNLALETTDETDKEMLGIIIKEIDTSERIIHSLLDFARTRAPELHPANVNEIIQDALSRVQIPNDPKIKTILNLDMKTPPIMADSEQLVQVFSNLLLNAVQAMPEGGQLEVTTKYDVFNGEQATTRPITITIADTGVGIPKENLYKIFDPLYSTKTRGIGLGLALVKTLLDGHDGTIEVKSNGIPGQGTSFTIKLPQDTVFEIP